MKNGALIECSTIEELHAEEEARIAADEELQKQVTENREACESETAKLQENLDAEIDARLAADKALQALLETEASQRQAADIALQSNIDTEATARAAADTALQGNISTEATQRAAADSALQAAIDAEAAARQSADTSLQAAITSEATQRAAADSALQAAIEAYLQSELESMQSQISALVATSGGYTIDEDGAYHVYTKDGLLSWMSAAASDATVGCTLESDIDMLSASLSPIGSSSSPYKGTFDGNGYAISNATISGDGTYTGFFGYTSVATIKNLTLNSVYVSTRGKYAGTLVGYMTQGTISNCSVSATVSGGYSTGGYTGGIVGYLYGAALSSYNNIEGCSFSGTVTVTQSSGIQYAGGIAGAMSHGVIASCANKGTVSTYCSEKSTYAGGIVGHATSGSITYSGPAITSCSNSGAVSASSDDGKGYAGYIAGRADNLTITSCTNTGSPSSQVGSSS